MSVNDTTNKTFDLDPTAAFDEGGTETRICFYCGMQYNKDKPEKFCIDLFVLENRTHYFVRNIYV